jgi:predicted alpha-1,2-mannosidase
MPVAGRLKTRVDEYAVPFSHKREIAAPSYYKLDLPVSHLVAEITATLRCGIMQFTMQQDDSLYLLITPNSDKEKGFVKIDAAKGEVWGYNPAYRIYQGWGNSAGFSGWFFIKIEKTIAVKGVYNSDGLYAADSIRDGKDLGAYVGFDMKKGEKLRIRIGTSFSSLDAAKQNLEAEIPAFDFEAVRTLADDVWEQALAKITISTNSTPNKKIFYTSMYHAMQHPRLFSDVKGSYPAFAGNYQLKKMEDGNYYDDFSMWDIYRAQLPLFEIIEPALINQFVRSMILKGQQGTWLPIFPCWNSYTAAMIGDHGTAFIASAYAKGIRDYDVKEAYRLMRKNAFEPAGEKDYINGMGRRALTSYMKYGYIPMEDSVQEAFHKKEQVSRTLEYAFDDYALSVVAKSTGNTADYNILRKRALNYRNVYDASRGMVRGRYKNGSWFSSFHPDLREVYITEGTPRQYSFYVPQDIPGLAGLMGGVKSLERSLDSLFIKNEYWHGNEPGHQIPFLYNFTDAPWKTQQQVQHILKDEYADGPGGLSGNDDAGQMSAWYIFASIGFYPVDPVSGNYQLCTPLFDSITVATGSNKTFRIVCHRNGPEDVYIRKVTLNGMLCNGNFITHASITKGGQLEIWLQSKPSAWGSKVGDRAAGL